MLASIFPHGLALALGFAEKSRKAKGNGSQGIWPLPLF
jgi:hypothetical protein